MERTSFFSEGWTKGSMLVNSVVKHKNKVVTSDVYITVVMEVKIIKSSVEIFQKRWKVKTFKTAKFWSILFGTFRMKIKVCKSGEMVSDVIDCNSSSGVVINYICIYTVWSNREGWWVEENLVGLFIRDIQPILKITVNIIRNLCVNLVFQ